MTCLPLFRTAILFAAVITVGIPGPAHTDSVRNREWIIGSLELTKAHRITEGGGITVAVIDTGVDSSNPDLSGNVLQGADFGPNRIDGNGHDDINGHGTGIAGLIAGHGHGQGHADGVLGIAPKAKILPVYDGDGVSVSIVPAVQWATSHGAKVICLAEGSTIASSQQQQAIEAAQEADIVVVAAVGNRPQDQSVAYPAAYPGVVAAAGTDEHGVHAAISATGSQVVLAAPADNIVADYLRGGYAVGTGTSASTAIIAGAAALVRARFPKLSAVEVIHRLTATAIDKGPPGRDDEYGYGLIDIVAALTANVPPLTDTSPSPSASITSGVPATPAPAAASTVIGTTVHTTNPNPLPFVVALVALLAVLGAWIVARRRTPG